MLQTGFVLCKCMHCKIPPVMFIKVGCNMLCFTFQIHSLDYPMFSLDRTAVSSVDNSNTCGLLSGYNTFTVICVVDRVCHLLHPKDGKVYTKVW